MPIIPASPTTPVVGFVNQSALQPFWYALGNRNSAPTKIMLIGDSWTAGAHCVSFDNHYGRSLQRGLVSRLSTIASPTPPGGWYYPAYQTSPNGPATFTLTGSPTQQPYFGPSVANVKFTTTGTASITVTGTSANLWFTRSGSATGSCTYKVDSGTATTVNIPTSGTGGTLDGYLVNITLGATGSHTVLISWVSGTIYFAGIEIFNGDETSGIHVIPSGRSGWSCADWNSTDIGTYQGIRSIVSTVAPDLVLIMLGTNDWSKEGYTAAQYQSNMTTLIGKIKAEVPNAAVGMVAQPFMTNQGSSVDTYANFVAALYNITASDSTVALFDLSTRMPIYSASNTYSLYYTDSLHPEAKGHILIGDLLAGALVP